METESGCPYSEPRRAALCVPCCEAARGLPPCVAAYVGDPALRRVAPVLRQPVSLTSWREDHRQYPKAA